jgi:gamma-glutamylcyclotransferase (GGCT)/AIG2-like uncharacterized protein YtfP
MSRAGTVRLFVYGLLRRGEISNHYLGNSVYEGPAATAPAFDLYHLGEYPALADGGATSVVGETYLVPGWRLPEMDLYEEVGVLYDRRAITLADGSSADAYLIIRAKMATQFPRAVVISTGDWTRR